MSRNTRERILSCALAEFNALGEPNVTTNRIAEALGISPGNLHYHFRTKADLIQALFERFEHRMLELLATPESRAVHIEDIWLFLHLAFEAISDYRFVYRDLSDLCARHSKIQRRVQAIMRLSMQTAHDLCSSLVDQSQMKAEPWELNALVRNIVLASSFWLSFDQVIERDAEPQPDRAVWQVMSLVSPYLLGEAREALNRIAEAYRSDR